MWLLDECVSAADGPCAIIMVISEAQPSIAGSRSGS